MSSPFVLVFVYSLPNVDSRNFALPLSSGADTRMLFAACAPFCAFQACMKVSMSRQTSSLIKRVFSTTPR